MKHLASFRIEELDDTETAFVSWDLDECDPRIEDIAYYDIDFHTRRVFAEYPRIEALEYVDACDVRACRGCEAPPPYCVCCTACGAPPHIACACDALLYRENDNDRATERALAAGF
jgi:hypothetical protein